MQYPQINDYNINLNKVHLITPWWWWPYRQQLRATKHGRVSSWKMPPWASHKAVVLLHIAFTRASLLAWWMLFHLSNNYALWRTYQVYKLAIRAVEHCEQQNSHCRPLPNGGANFLAGIQYCASEERVTLPFSRWTKNTSRVTTGCRFSPSMKYRGMCTMSDSSLQITPRPWCASGRCTFTPTNISPWRRHTYVLQPDEPIFRMCAHSW